MLTRRWIIAAILAAVALTGGPGSAHAETAEETFFKGQACYARLREAPEKMQYRDNWFPCIGRFQDAYTAEPGGRYAAASLYMAGKLYAELYRRSGVAADRKEAIDYFQRVRRRFPNSAYRPKADDEMAALSARSARSAPAAPPEIKRVRVEKSLEPEPEAAAPAGGDPPPHKRRGAIYRAAKAQYRQGRARETVAVRKAGRSASRPAPATDQVTVTGLRVWSNPNYTRIVVDANGETGYNYRFLEQDPSIDKPERLYIDFENAALGDNIQKIVPINDDLLLDARAGQYSRDAVRVVIDIKSFKNYKIFSLRNPFRTVIDVWGRDAGAEPAFLADSDQRPPPSDDTDRGGDAPLAIPPRDDPVTANDLAKQLALNVNRIVIDPGHGGRDAGAVGYHSHVHEKDVVLAIGKRLARVIRKRLGCDVVMTRTTDRFLTLEERTAIANTRNADLFISLHTNAHRNRNAYGIETYFLNLATDDDAILVAARENATSRKNISDLQAILNDLMQNAKINESSRLAAHVQRSLFSQLKTRYGQIKDKGVKQAPFYVLLGAQMPAVLVETSFISNKRECNRLTNSSYQQHLVEGIYRGIRDYIRETNPTALLGPQGKRSG